MSAAAPLPAHELVAEDVVLDGRLALFHQVQRWLAVADLHFGYEISQRASGALLPLWGMQSVRDRLLDLLGSYKPGRLVVLGDLVHDRSAAAEARELVEELSRSCEVVLISGNHDRKLLKAMPFVESWRTPGFVFHHGHCAVDAMEEVQVIGHHHPAATLSDGAGLRLKLPAFVQQDRCWIMPAFSPWAAGTTWRGEAPNRTWMCTPQRILRLEATTAAA